MNSQNTFKIQFQLTKKGSEAQQAALIIQSFDLLSWLNQDCKIGVISQNKIQVLINQNNKKKIKLPKELLGFKLKDQLLEKIKVQSELEFYKGFELYTKKEQNQEILIKQILKKIDSNKQSRKFSFRDSINRVKNITQNQTQNKEFLKCRKFKINRKFTFQNKQYSDTAITTSQKIQKNPQFYLIEKSKNCFSKKYKNNVNSLRAQIEYILVDSNQIDNEKIYEFKIYISTNTWINQDIKLNIQLQYMKKQNLKLIGRKIFRQMEEQAQQQGQSQKQNKKKESTLIKISTELQECMNLYMNNQLNRSIIQYFNKQNTEKMFVYKKDYNKQKNIKNNTEILQIRLQQMEENRKFQMSQIHHNLLINQFKNQQVRKFTVQLMDDLMKKLVNELNQQQEEQNKNKYENSKQMKAKIIKQRHQTVKQYMLKIVKNSILEMIKNTMVQWIKKMMKQKIKKQLSQKINTYISKQLLTLGSTNIQIKNNFNKLDQRCNKQNIRQIIDPKQTKLQIVKWTTNYMNKLYQQYRNLFMKTYKNNKYFRKQLAKWIMNFIVQPTDYLKNENKMLTIQVFNFQKFAQTYCNIKKISINQPNNSNRGPIAFDIDDYMRKCFIEQNKRLSPTQFEYPYIQSDDLKYKNCSVEQGKPYYALAFQGGGAKGIAYVGVYKALLQTQIPIKNIIGSSVGGIFALAVSSGITPNELEKLCYPLSQVSKSDRIIIQKSQQRDKKQKQVSDAIKLLLDQHGILPENIFNYVKQLLTPNVLKKLRICLETLNQTLGNIIGATQKGDTFNYYGLLLKGAAMKGQAIQNVASECLVKYMLKHYLNRNDEMQLTFSNKKWALIKYSLQRYNQNFQKLKYLTINQVLRLDNPQMSKQIKKTLIITIVNRCLLYLSELIQNQKVSQEASSDIQIEQQIINKFHRLNQLNFKQVLNIFSLKSIEGKKLTLQQQITYEVINNNYQYNIDFTEQDWKIFQIEKIQQFNEDLCKNIYNDYFLISKFTKSQQNTPQSLQIRLKQTIKLINSILGLQILENGQDLLKFRLYQLIDQLKSRETQLRKCSKQQLKINLAIKLQQKQDFKQNLLIILQIVSEIVQNQKKQLLKWKIVTLKDFQTFFGKPLILDPKLFQWKQQIQQIQQNLYFYKILLNISNRFQDHHWKQIADIITQTVVYFYQKRNSLYFKQYLQTKDKQLGYWQKAKNMILCHKTLQQVNYVQPLNIKIQTIRDKIKDYNDLKNIMKIITLQQYYKLTKVQLTLTSVDLNMKTLRFFNHKTTPHLPVCISVQMTGSFPFGFQAQTWKQQWGNYFIHYDNIRRQIILTGHQFTDGGMLANFPIKYLDNQIMRPKYFSHYNTKNTCKFFGFGLDDLTSENYYRNPQQIQIKYQASNKFQDAFKNLIDQLKTCKHILKGIVSYFLSSNGQKITINDDFKNKIMQNLQKIPLLKFAIKFLDAYPNADRYLNVQCFSQNIILQQKQELQNEYIQQQQNININKDRQQRIYNVLDSEKYQSTIINIQQNIQIIEKLLISNSIQNTYFNIQKQMIIQNIILNRQVNIIYHFKNLQDYVDVPTGSIQNMKYVQQFNRKIDSHRFARCSRQMKQQLTESMQGFESQIKLTMINAMMYNMKKQLDYEQINSLTIQSMFRRAKNLSKQIIQESLNTHAKALYLAKLKFKKMFSMKQFDQIQMLACFKDYKKIHYKKLCNNELQQRQAVQRAFQKLSLLNLKQLGQFINIGDELITKNQKNFTIFIYSMIIKFQQKQIWHNLIQQIHPDVLISNSKNTLSVQKILQIWNRYFYKESETIQLTEENIIKNYFQWELAQKLFIQLKTDTHKIFQVFRTILSKNKNKFNQQDDKHLLLMLNKLKQKKMKNQHQTSILRQILDQQQQIIIFITKCYKQNIFSVRKNNFVSIFLRKLNQQYYNKYILQKSLEVINRLQMNRFCHLIKLIMNRTQQLNLTEVQEQLKKRLLQVFKLNISMFYSQNNISQNAINNEIKQKINIILEQYYQHCIRQIYRYYLDKKNDSIGLIWNLKEQIVITTIINYQQKRLREKIKMQGIQSLVIESLKSQQSLLRKNAYLVKFICLNQSFQRHIYQIDVHLIQKRLKQKQSLKQKKIQQISSCSTKQKKEAQYKFKKIKEIIIKYKKCKYDYQYMYKLLNQLCITLSQQITSDPFINFQKIISSWRIQIQSILSLPKSQLSCNKNKINFFHFKRTVIQNCRKYFILIWKISSIKSIKKQQITILGRTIYNQLSFKFGLFKKQFHIKQQIKHLQYCINDIQKFFQLIRQQPYAKIQVYNVQKFSQEKQMSQLFDCFREIKQSITQKLSNFNLYQDEQIYVEDIQELFLINGKIFQVLSNFEQNSLKSNRWFFKKLSLHKFSIPLYSIDKKLMQKQKRINIKNQIFSILNRQIKNIRESNNMNQPNYKLHLVMEGFGKSHLYYSTYIKLIQQSIMTFKASKSVENQILSFTNAQQTEYKISQINIQLSAITCSYFHCVFGFLYTLGLKNEELRKEMNRIQSIATVLQTNINQSFNEYKWTACSQMEIKMCFEQIWKDQFNTFDDLQKQYILDVDIIKHLESLKQMYLADKNKILSYCQNSFDYLLDFIRKKISSQTFQKRKLQICKGLGISYICDNETQHKFNNLNTESSKQVQQLMKALFNRYQSLIQYVLTSNQLILKNFSINQGNKQSLWKGIIIKKLYSTFKLKQYICKHLIKQKMKPNITLGEFYEQANKKILLTFTTIDNLNSKIQFMNKITFPNMPVWAAILASTSLHFLYRQFQARKQWTTNKFQVQSFFSIIVNDFFEKKNTNNGIPKYSCGNFISTLPLQLLTNRKVCQQMFEQKNNKQKYIYLALAFKSLPRKPQSYNIILDKKYLTGAASTLFGFIIEGMNPKQKLSQITNYIQARLGKWFCFKKLCLKSKSELGHENNTYQVDKFNYISHKLFKLASYGVSGKVFHLLKQSNDNLIMSLYRDKVIKCPIKIGTLDFNSIVSKNKKQTNINLPSVETLQTIDRSYEITKCFIQQQTKQRQVLIRIQIFSQYNLDKSIKKENDNIKCRLSFLSHSQWIKNPQRQFIVQYSLWEQQFKHGQAQNVQNSQIVWNAKQNNSIYLKFFYPFNQKIGKKQKRFIVESKLFVSFAPVLQQFFNNQKLNYLPSSVSFDYLINYTLVKKKDSFIQAINMNRIPLLTQIQKNKYTIIVQTNYNTSYSKNKNLQFRNQFTNFIMERTYSSKHARKILAYSHISQRNKNKEVSLVCIHCYQSLTLLSNQLKSHYKCYFCDKYYGKLICLNKQQGKKFIGKDCQKTSYCLSCLNQYIFQRKKKKIICLLCTTIQLNVSLQTLSDIRGSQPTQPQTNSHIYTRPQLQRPFKDNQQITLNESQLKIKPDNHEQSEEQCHFCYQPYSKTMLFSCERCRIKICNKCVSKNC